MTVHMLKSWPEFFSALESGEKNFELRRNDRGFVIGDTLLLREWEPKTESYSGRGIERHVTYVLHGAGVGCIEPLKGLAIGYAILGLGNERRA